MATLTELQDALQNAHAAGDEQAATAIADEIVRMTGPRTSLESAKFQELTNPQYTISPQNIALGSAIGGVLGGGEVALAKGALQAGKLAYGTLRGATTGAAATTAGEAVREATNNSPTGQLWALGAELATGSIPSLAGDLFSRTASPALTAMFGYKTGKTAQAITGRSESDIAARNRIFGYAERQPGVATDVFRSQQQNLDREYLAGLGISIGADEIPSQVLRNSFYDVMSKNTFKGSPEHLDMMAKLKQGVKDGYVKPEDFANISKLISGEKNISPKAVKPWEERLLNTAQQATKEHNEIKISDGAAGIMKEALDGYTQRLTNVPLFSTLKSMETQGFTAEARDSIPVLLQKGFKGADIEQALANLAKSPEGKTDFRIALASYLKSLPEQEALERFNDLYKVIQKTKSMDAGELALLKSQVAKFTSKTALGKAGDISRTALRASIIRGVLPSEVMSRLNAQEEALKPFNM